MTKAEIINEISQKTGIEKNQVGTTIEALMNTIKEHISKKEFISLRGFGNFSTKKRATKKARDIKRSITISLPEHFIPTFKPARIFKQKVKKAIL